MLAKIRSVLENMNDADRWALQVLQINTSARSGVTYIGREISFEPDTNLGDFIQDVQRCYVGERGCYDSKFVTVTSYDGSADGKVIYHLKSNDPLISEEYERLITALANPDAEVDPFKMKLRASVLHSTIRMQRREYSVKLISMQNPVTLLKHRFWRNNGRFQEINDKVLKLRPTIDVMIIDDDIFFFTLAGENLFDMERSYKALSAKHIAEIEESGIISNMEVFSAVANAGHNPRRFVSYNQACLEKLGNVEIRRKIAEKFSIPMREDQLDTSEKTDSEKLVKILCNKGMIDPFDGIPMEVSGAKKWE